MKIELRRITHNKRLSEETPAYAADIYIDGVKRGTTQNDGHGGMDRTSPHTLMKELDEHAKTFPPLPPAWKGGPPLDMDGELLLHTLLEEHLLAKDLKSMMSKKTVFTAKGEPGKLYSMKAPAKPKDAEAILNDLPFDVALGIFRKMVGG